ncbi:hypothetical protein N177_2701 [Lutibaculum baratangense AMV1]|uniref:Uncharacterized protein n=1 Tax=Lutibaculum baratangense AMV1 TaxID=631454 RepID=V4QWV3_9HYPH|nr:hypothetical protein N177_2701 [Lutibaculum baratangense AMV1]
MRDEADTARVEFALRVEETLGAPCTVRSRWAFHGLLSFVSLPPVGFPGSGVSRPTASPDRLAAPAILASWNDGGRAARAASWPQPRPRDRPEWVSITVLSGRQNARFITGPQGSKRSIVALGPVAATHPERWSAGSGRNREKSRVAAWHAPLPRGAEARPCAPAAAG